MKLNSIGYLIKSGFKGIFSHGLMSFATVAIIMACLIIMGCFALLVVNINDMIAGLEDESNVVVAFIDENLSREEAVALEPVIMAVPNVDSAQFVTREEAAEDFKSDYDPEIFDVLTDDTFRDRYVVQLQDISLMEQTRTDLLPPWDGVGQGERASGVRGGFHHGAKHSQHHLADTHRDTDSGVLLHHDQHHKARHLHQAGGDSHHEDGGGLERLIRCPFIVEGLILGLLGGGLAFLAEWGLYGLVAGKLVGGLTGTFITVVPFAAVCWPLLAAFLAVGVLVGVFGGSSAIRNYLKV